MSEKSGKPSALGKTFKLFLLIFVMIVAWMFRTGYRLKQ